SNTHTSQYAILTPSELGQSGGYQAYDGDKPTSLTTPVADNLGTNNTQTLPATQDNYVGGYEAADQLPTDTASGTATPVVPITTMMSEGDNDSGTDGNIINPTYRELQGLNKDFQAHHILPQYLGSMLGYTKEDMMDHPATLVTQWTHTGKVNPDALHKAISKYLPPMTGGKRANYSADEIKNGLQNAYEDIGRPELFESIKHLIK